MAGQCSIRISEELETLLNEVTPHMESSGFIRKKRSDAKYQVTEPLHFLLKMYKDIYIDGKAEKGLEASNLILKEISGLKRTMFEMNHISGRVDTSIGMIMDSVLASDRAVKSIDRRVAEIHVMLDQESLSKKVADRIELNFEKLIRREISSLAVNVELLESRLESNTDNLGSLKKTIRDINENMANLTHVLSSETAEKVNSYTYKMILSSVGFLFGLTLEKLEAIRLTLGNAEYMDKEKNLMVDLKGIYTMKKLVDGFKRRVDLTSQAQSSQDIMRAFETLKQRKLERDNQDLFDKLCNETR